MQTTQKTREKLKHQQVYDQLVNVITTRHNVGDRLPSERDFAAELKVNVLTVRRAFRDLIAAGFVTKRVGSGTYLNREITSNWRNHAVNLVIDISCNGAIQKLFQQYGPSAAEKHQKKYRFIYTNAAKVREFVRSCVQYRQPTIFCGTLPIYREFREDVAEAPELFVSAGACYSEQGIASVIGSDAVGIDMLMTYLQKSGHRRIALVCSRGKKNSAATNSILAMQKSAWMTRLENDYDPELYFAVDTFHYDGDQIIAAYEDGKKTLTQTDFSAVICATDELMYGFMAALRENGKKIPEDVSVVSIGNTNLSRFACPPVTGIDLNLEGHLDEAFKLLFCNLDNPEQMEMLRVIKPVLVERESVIKHFCRKS